MELRKALTLLLIATASAACGSAPAVPPAAQAGLAGPGEVHADSPAGSPRTSERRRRYAFITVGRPAGAAELRIAADGTRASHFAFNDRGRGPDLTTTVVADERGWPRQLHTQGNDYLKAQVEEDVHLAAGTLRWRSSSEDGSASASAGFFVPSYGPFDASAMLVRALDRAPGKRLPLLPAGEAWIEDEQPLQVEVAGAPRTLRQVALAGLGFSPELLWLDEDGELFASVSPWSSLIEAGAEPLIATLLEVDQRWTSARAARLAAELAQPQPAAGVAITHARLFDSERKRVRDDVTVVLRGDQIVAVGGPSTKIPAGARVIDAAGKTLLPGLWDMHVHLGGDAGLLNLAMGITTVRDLGNDADTLAQRKARFDAGSELGPRVLRAGLIDGPGELAAPTGALASTVEAARAHIERFAKAGYQQIKLYSSLDPTLVPEIARISHALGLRVSGHIPNGMTAAQAVRAGYDEIQHANMLLLNFLQQPGDDTRGPTRFTRVAEGAAALDLRSPAVTEFLALLKARKTVLDPTLMTFEAMFTSEPQDPDPGIQPYFGQLPAQIERGARGGGLPAPDGKRATYRASHAAMGKLVQLAWSRGIPIVAGTDATAGLSLARELELYVAAGIPAADVLALATLGAARVMKLEREVGSVAVGKRADLVLIDGDPLKDIGAVRNTELVIARGVLFDPAGLLAAVGMRPRGAR